MSREIEIEGQIVKLVTSEDIAPKGIEELRELCKTARPSRTNFWNAPIKAEPEKPSEPST